MRCSLPVALVLCAGTCATALAQNLAIEPNTEPYAGMVYADPIGYPANPYAHRAPGLVYDNATNTFTGVGNAGSVANWRHGLEDISFVPGPWATATTRLIDQFTWSLRAVTNTTPADALITFWRKNDVTYAGFTGTGTSMISTSATPLAQVRIALSTAYTNGNIYQITSVLTGLPGGGVSVPDDGFWLEVAFVNTGTSTVISTDAWRCVLGNNSTAPAGGNPATVGSTSVDIGFDQDYNGVFAGAAAYAGTLERRSYTFATTPARCTGYLCSFRGDIVAPPPSGAVELGCLSDGVTTQTPTVPNAAPQWYHFCLASGIDDCFGQFFDADTEGSSADFSIALFDNTGALLSTDLDSGSGTNAQLTYGVGRRAAVGDGRQYDGRNGLLGASDFYLAVAPAGSTFGSGYTVNGAGTGGAGVVNFNTNTNGTPAAPSVTPRVTGIDYNDVPVIGTGPLTFSPPDARQGTAQATGVRDVLWSRFDTTDDATAANGNFIDMEFSRLSATNTDGVAYVFNASGDIVAFSDDEGPGALPMFSFGDTSTPRTYNGQVEVYQGGNGDLPAGTYYVAAALYPAADVAGCGLGSDRFHVRGTSGSNLVMSFDIFTGANSVGCQVTCDYNQDGGADTSDVIDLANDIASGTESFPGSCSDYNQDGGSDTSDVIDLANAIASGSC